MGTQVIVDERELERGKPWQYNCFTKKAALLALPFKDLEVALAAIGEQ